MGKAPGDAVMSATIDPKNFREDTECDEGELMPVRSLDWPGFDWELEDGPHWVVPLLALALLVFAAPVIAICWALVRLTSAGPGIYRQSRIGRCGRRFNIIKLRTMAIDCEARTGAVWAQQNDPRVTWIGRILRATHCDELPQLLNVVRGEIALVGPRPERPEIIEKLLPTIPHYLERLRVSPGITGLAQIFWGADRTIDDVHHKLNFDLYYVENQSWWLDTRIILATVLKMLHLNTKWMRGVLFPEVCRTFPDF